jgi:hypothetical protein
MLPQLLRSAADSELALADAVGWWWLVVVEAEERESVADELVAAKAAVLRVAKDPTDALDKRQDAAGG